MSRIYLARYAQLISLAIGVGWMAASLASLPTVPRQGPLSEKEMAAVLGADCGSGCYTTADPNNGCVQPNQCIVATCVKSGGPPAGCQATGRHYIGSNRDICATPVTPNNQVCEPPTPFPCYQIYSCTDQTSGSGTGYYCSSDNLSCVQSMNSGNECRQCGEDPQPNAPWVPANTYMCMPCGT